MCIRDFSLIYNGRYLLTTKTGRIHSYLSAVTQLFYDATPRIVETSYGLLRKTTTKPENELMSLLRALISSVPQKFVHSYKNRPVNLDESKANADCLALKMCGFQLFLCLQ